METQITVRLPTDLSKGLELKAKKLRLKKSDVLRLALASFLQEIPENPFEQVKELIGSVESGIPDLGQNHREHLLRKFKKHAPSSH